MDGRCLLHRHLRTPSAWSSSRPACPRAFTAARRYQQQQAVCQSLQATRCLFSRSAAVESRQQRRSCHTCFRAAASEVAQSAPQAEAQELPQEWQSVLEYKASGKVLDVKINMVNRGGAVTELHGLKAFIPYSKLDPELVYGSDEGASLASEDQVAQSMDADDILSGNGIPRRQINILDMEQRLVGKTVRCKIVQVDVPQKGIVLSEKAAYTSDLANADLKTGDTVEGVVRTLKDFGAFVALRSPDGHMHGAEGMIHISELSWDRIGTPDAVVQPGDEVRCKILRIDPAKSRISLSLKRMDQDPLKQRLEDVLPLEEAEKILQVPAEIPASIEAILTALSDQEGIDDITLGRQVEEKRAVSQDLELWISREGVADGFNLVARAERTVQELHVKTQLSAQEMKRVVQTVLQKLL